MSDLNEKHTRVVWLDVPVSDLKRAARFYSAVMAIEVEEMKYEGGSVVERVLQSAPTAFVQSSSTARATASRCIRKKMADHEFGRS
jgi:hypothetical protein